MENQKLNSELFVQNGEWKSVDEDNALLGMKVANLNKLVYLAFDPLATTEEKEGIEKLGIEDYLCWQVKDDAAPMEALKEIGLATTGLLTNVCLSITETIPFVCFRGTKTINDVISDFTSMQIVQFTSRQGNNIGKTGLGMMKAYVTLRDMDLTYKQQISLKEKSEKEAAQSVVTDTSTSGETLPALAPALSPSPAPAPTPTPTPISGETAPSPQSLFLSTLPALPAFPSISLPQLPTVPKPEYSFGGRVVEEGLLDYAVRMARQHNNRLLVTGHSLGGALANLLAAEIWTDYPEELTLYIVTYGAPRVFDVETAERLFTVSNLHSGRYLRFINSGDIIAQIGKIGGFEHVEIKQAEGGTVDVRETSGEESSTATNGTKTVKKSDSIVALMNLDHIPIQSLANSIIVDGDNQTSKDKLLDSKVMKKHGFSNGIPPPLKFIENLAFIAEYFQNSDGPQAKSLLSQLKGSSLYGSAAEFVETMPNNEFSRGVKLLFGIQDPSIENTQVEATSTSPILRRSNSGSVDKESSAASASENEDAEEDGEIDETVLSMLDMRNYSILEDAAEVISFAKKLSFDPTASEKIADLLQSHVLGPIESRLYPSSEFKQKVSELFSMEFAIQPPRLLSDYYERYEGEDSPWSPAEDYENKIETRNRSSSSHSSASSQSSVSARSHCTNMMKDSCYDEIDCSEDAHYSRIQDDNDEEMDVTVKRMMQFVPLSHVTCPHFHLSGDWQHLCSEEHFDWSGNFNFYRDATDIATFLRQFGGAHLMDSQNGYIAQFLNSKVYQDALNKLDDESPLKKSFSRLPICKLG